MSTGHTAPTTIDEYIAGFPPKVQAILKKVRQTIRKAAPGTEERISYQIPTFTLNGKYVVYFAGFSKHISVYPVPTGTAELRREMAAYKVGKGTLRFSLDKPIPYELITKVVKASLKANQARARAKAKKK